MTNQAPSPLFLGNSLPIHLTDPRFNLLSHSSVIYKTDSPEFKIVIEEEALLTIKLLLSSKDGRIKQGIALKLSKKQKEEQIMNNQSLIRKSSFIIPTLTEERARAFLGTTFVILIFDLNGSKLVLPKTRSKKRIQNLRYSQKESELKTSLEEFQIRKNRQNPLKHLPNDVTLEILSYLTISDLAILFMTSKEWNFFILHQLNTLVLKPVIDNTRNEISNRYNIPFQTISRLKKICSQLKLEKEDQPIWHILVALHQFMRMACFFPFEQSPHFFALSNIWAPFKCLGKVFLKKVETPFLIINSSDIKMTALSPRDPSSPRRRKGDVINDLTKLKTQHQKLNTSVKKNLPFSNSIEFDHKIKGIDKIEKPKSMSSESILNKINQNENNEDMVIDLLVSTIDDQKFRFNDNNINNDRNNNNNLNSRIHTEEKSRIFHSLHEDIDSKFVQEENSGSFGETTFKSLGDSLEGMKELRKSTVEQVVNSPHGKIKNEDLTGYEENNNEKENTQALDFTLFGESIPNDLLEFWKNPQRVEDHNKKYKDYLIQKYETAWNQLKTQLSDDYLLNPPNLLVLSEETILTDFITYWFDLIKPFPSIQKVFDINRLATENLLKNEPVGSFVVRSSSLPGRLAASVRTVNSIVHHLICKRTEGFYREKNTKIFPTLEGCLAEIPSLKLNLCLNKSIHE